MVNERRLRGYSSDNYHLFHSSRYVKFIILMNLAVQKILQ